MSVVTIRGQLGSWAPEIGREVAERLKGDYVDRQIIAEVAARLQQREEDVMAKEMPPSRLLGRIAEALEHSYGFGEGIDGAYLPVWQIPLNDMRYLQALESVIKELAGGKKSIVIRGRGSHRILKDHPGALHVLTVAPLEVRVQRVMEDLKLEREPAKKEIAYFDSSSREFVRRYFHSDLENPVAYHLVVNTEHFSLQAAVSIILNALSSREGSKNAV